MKRKEIIEDVIIFIILIILAAGVILPREVNNLDELWNFNFARNIANGKSPYKDFNMLQTPLLPILCGGILRIFGTELIVMRIMAVIMSALILMVIIKIMKSLNINRYLMFLSILVIYLLYIDYFTIDYNFLVMLITLILTFLEIKHYNTDKISLNIFFGILAGSTILIKQTTGMVLTLIFIFYQILLINKKNYKYILKTLLLRFAGTLVPVILGILYLVFNNILEDFINYAILGIGTFNNYVSYFKLLSSEEIGIRLISLLIPIVLIIMYVLTIIKTQTTKFQKNLFILFVYGVAEMFVIFPISTFGYLIMGMLDVYIGFIYLIDYYIINMPKIAKIYLLNFCKMLLLISLIFLVIYNLIEIKTYFITAKDYDSVKNFKYIKCSNKVIKEVDNFIIERENEGKTVYILDYTAAIYMIPLNKYNKDYDMFLKGNLGAEGEQGQIEKIKKMDSNVIILILNENYVRNWQNPEKVRKYIVENLTKTGEIYIFDIYVM